MSTGFYTVKEMAQLLKKSENLIYRRLTELPRRYYIKGAHKEGNTWRFNRKKIDQSIEEGGSVLCKIEELDKEIVSVEQYLAGRTKIS